MVLFDDFFDCGPLINKLQEKQKVIGMLCKKKSFAFDLDAAL
jgi:hypothetical protein